jgi:CelD/BcsL family acetyltransferase involved in cellulose biosynthesis
MRKLRTSSGDELECRVVPAAALKATEVHAWDSLCRAHLHLSSPFLTPHYARAVASVRPHVYVCVLSRDGRPVGFLGFQYRTGFSRLLRAAERLGEEMTDYFGLVADPGVQLTSQDVLRATGLHSLTFTHLDESQRGYGLTGETPELGLLVRLDREQSYWEWLRKTHKKFVANTDRGQRQVEQTLGALRFTVAETEWQQPLQQLMDYKGQQYRQTGNENLFVPGWRRKLLEVLADCREASCTGMMSTLYAGDTWLASHFGLRNEICLHYCFPVYNPEFSRFGPGRVLLKLLLEHAPGLGIQIIDLGAGEAFYKKECSNDQHFYYRGKWSAASSRALVWRVAESLSWRYDRLRAAQRALALRGRPRHPAADAPDR